MRNWFVVLVFPCCMAETLLAQCDITVLMHSARPTCLSGQRTVLYELQWSGGTPPFTVLTDGTINTVFQQSLTAYGPTIGGGVTPYSYNGSGSQGYGITDALGCTASGSWMPWYPYPWIYDDATNAFVADVGTSACASGLFDVSLLDNPGDGGTPFLSPPAECWYTLTRNGSTIASNSFVPILQQLPVPRLFFPSLAGGNYVCTYTLGFNSVNPLYCPSTGSISFFVPNTGDCGVNVMVKSALQGALPGGTVMTDALRSAGLIPLTEPYTALGYSWTGSPPGAAISGSLLAVTGNDAIADWVVVELRNATTPAQVLYSKAALIQRDGDVIDTDGDTYVGFPLAAGNYHVALRHRNHLGVMTSNARALGLTPVTVDFRSAATTCYGITPRAQVGSVFCLWSGDGNGNGQLKYTGTGNDRDPILIAVGSTTPNNTVPNAYDRRDTNLDGVIKYTGTANDRDVILTNVGSTTPNSTRTQQLP